MSKRLDMDKIAKGLGAERAGKVTAKGGAFGAQQLLIEIQSRFRSPITGGRATDPAWTERRLVPLAPATLDRLEVLAEKVGERSGVTVQPMQLAALLLERSTADLSTADVLKLLGA